jgi:hypothetical protein
MGVSDLLLGDIYQISVCIDRLKQYRAHLSDYRYASIIYDCEL